MTGSRNWVAPSPRRLSKADAVLAALVLALVGVMIVPLPTWLLDLLLASNLAASIVILLVSLYVSDALKIAAFPTLLLITTLIRLSLNVSSTRLILLQANAGEVIRAFGEFVVRGNYVVGAVIFAILTIIQFVVIAKGSERVAEVGARFTLDAMPGKQLAIDAELRSGAIDGAEARKRRRALARESQFYGAMDGAMKFVKGDVIASFVITLINLLGGIAIGVGQKNMELVAALKRYGLLTIGDGLVTQIPALVLATSAGVLVTRVTSEQADRSVGMELSKQLLGQPRALRSASFFVIGLGAVPGLPVVPFLVIGGLLWVISRAEARYAEREARREALGPVQRQEAEAGPVRFVPVVVPWALELGPGFERLLEDRQQGGEVRWVGIRSACELLREQVFRKLGAPLPPCRILIEPGLPERAFRLSLHELPALQGRVPETLSADEVPDYLSGELEPVLLDRAHEFLGLSETQALLDQLEQVAPSAVRQVVPKALSVPELREVLRRLLEERISIRDLKLILEVVSEEPALRKDLLELTEAVRAHLRRAITYELAGEGKVLRPILLHPLIEDTVRGAISTTSSGRFLALAPAAARDIVAGIRAAVTQHDATVLLTASDTRRFVRKLIETELPHVRVTSYAELLPEVTVQPLATATVGEA